MTEQIRDLQARVGLNKRESDHQSDLAVQIDDTIESRSICLEYTKAMDFADKRTRVVTGKYANRGEPCREHPRTSVEYTEAMDFADKRTIMAA